MAERVIRDDYRYDVITVTSFDDRVASFEIRKKTPISRFYVVNSSTSHLPNQFRGDFLGFEYITTLVTSYLDARVKSLPPVLLRKKVKNGNKSVSSAGSSEHTDGGSEH